MGTREVFPLAFICNTATARGPVLLLDLGFRSPGVICGRVSCARTAMPFSATRNPIPKTPLPIPRCKIFFKAGPDRPAIRAIHLNPTLGICMKLNDKAPDFALPDENGKEVALKDFRGKTVILFFYPRANTPG